MDPITNIASALAAKGWSQAELSRVTGIDRTLINRYCNGLTPTPEASIKIIEALGNLRDGVRTPIRIQVSDDV